MKFGKQILKAKQLSPKEWHEYWLNYKQLKGMIKNIKVDENATRHKSEAKAGGVSKIDPQGVVQELARSPEEKAFFLFLHKEVQKLTRFYTVQEKGMEAKLKHIVVDTEALAATAKVTGQTLAQIFLDFIAQGGGDGVSLSRLQQQKCVAFHKDLLLLENFALINYLGFSKILKKHDKVTQFVTRKKYMINIVNKHSFTRHVVLTTLIQRTEDLFQQLTAAYPNAQPSASSSNTLHQVKQLNCEIVRMRREEFGEDVNSSAETLTLLAQQADKVARQEKDDDRISKRQKLDKTT